MGEEERWGRKEGRKTINAVGKEWCAQW